MGATPYRPVNYAEGDVITIDAVNQVNANLQWLYENTPSARYYRQDLSPVDPGPMILGGKVKVPVNKKTDTATVKVAFPTAFAPGTIPHITTSVIANSQFHIFLAVHGPGKTMLPTYQGCEFTINVADPTSKTDSISQEFYIHWIAYGFRQDNVNEF